MPPQWIEAKGIGMNKTIALIKVENIASIDAITNENGEIITILLFGVGFGDDGFTMKNDRYNLTDLIKLFHYFRSKTIFN